MCTICTLLIRIYLLSVILLVSACASFAHTEMDTNCCRFYNSSNGGNLPKLKVGFI